MRSHTRIFNLLVAFLLLIGAVMQSSIASAKNNEQRVTFATPVLVTNTSFLNVRQGPGVEYAVLLTVVGGSELPVLGTAGDGVWYQVNTDSGVGWVNVNFTLPRGDFSNVPLVDFDSEDIPDSDSGTLGQGGGSSVAPQVQYGVSFNGGDLHEAPSYDSLMIRSAYPAAPNTIYPLLGRDTTNGEWYQLLIPELGVVWTDQATLRPIECGNTRIGVTVEGAPIRFDSIANRDSFGLDVGTELYIVGFSQILPDHYRVQLLDGTVGLVPVSAIEDRSDTIVSICNGVQSAVNPGQGGGSTTGNNTTTNINARVVVNTGNLNVRSGPGGNFSVVTTVPGGTELGVVGRTSSGEWYLVNTGSSGQGWVDKDFVIFRGVFNVVPVVQASDGLSEGAGVTTGNRVIVNTGNLNIRSGPSASFSTVATVPGGTELGVIGRASDNVWYLVEGAFGRGWLNSEFTIFRGTYSTIPVIDNAFTVTNVGVTSGQGGGAVPTNVGSGSAITGARFNGGNLHQTPDYDSLIIRSAYPAQPNFIYPVIAQVTTEGNEWYQIFIPEFGAVWTDQVELRLVECGTDEVGVTVENTAIRFDGIANRDSFTLSVGTELYITGRRDNQLIVELLDGTVGLVSTSSIESRSDEIVSVCDGVPAISTSTSSVTPATSSVNNTTSNNSIVTQPTGNRVVVNTGNLNVRSGPGAGFSVVATVAGGSELSVVGRAPDGVWYLVEGTFGQGWLNSRFTIFRGNYSTVPVIDF